MYLIYNNSKRCHQLRSQPKIWGGEEQNFIGLSSGAHRVRQWRRGSQQCGGEAPSRRKLRGSGGRAPSRHEFLGVLQEKHSFQRSFFLSKKNTQVAYPPSNLNPPLLVLIEDLSYCISIFVCRLVVTENILRGNCPLCPPLGIIIQLMIFLVPDCR